MKAVTIVNKAIQVRTLEDAKKLQAIIQKEVGNRYERPIADRWKNEGLLSGSGTSYDLKVVELVTNMQDAVLEKAAFSKFGSLEDAPFLSPAQAAADLFNGEHYKSLAEKCVVEFWEAESDPKRSRRLTITFRDRGCGLSPHLVPNTIFHLGAGHKDEIKFLQGAFGLGGALTYRNSQAIVLVTRRHPDLLGPQEEEDRVTIAVVEWHRHTKTSGAFYLVESDPQNGRKAAVPFSVLAAGTSFLPGTYLALISYGVEGYHRARLGDERSFDTVLNTRLFRPVLPIRFSNQMIRTGRKEYLRGLGVRLENNPRKERAEGSEYLPYRSNGTTHHLPIRFYVFPKGGESGERRKFVAHNHAVIFTSNGQVHKHWNPQEFRIKTGLNKLYGRILVVVETDKLPITLRTGFFTPDRSDFSRNPEAIRLEEQVAAFLSAWNELKGINNQLIREAIQGSNSERPTINTAKKISRALKVKGFSLSNTGRRGGNPGGGGVSPKIELYDDPTTLEGPAHVVAKHGKTKFVNFVLNATDDFIPRRAKLAVTCTHSEVGDQEITVGALRKGLVRVSVAVPLYATKGVFKLNVRLLEWLRSSGGLGRPMEWTTKFEIVDRLRDPSGPNPGNRKGKKGAGKGTIVALIWTKHQDQEDWNKTTVGEVQMVPSKDLAEKHSDYSELSGLDVEIPTILLNEEFYILKRYLGRRVRQINDLEGPKNRYAVGAGVGLFLLNEDYKKQIKKGKSIDNQWVLTSQLAVGRSVVSMMPAFEELARETGIEE